MTMTAQDVKNYLEMAAGTWEATERLDAWAWAVGPYKRSCIGSALRELGRSADPELVSKRANDEYNEYKGLVE